ncbi:MAG TPA: cytochrome c [Kofleriaceae bacterium]
MRWLLVSIALAGCEPTPPADGPADGAAVYGKYCIGCHGPTGKPTAQMIATLNVRDLTAPELRARITASLVEAQVRNGSQNTLMPAFERVIPGPQIKAVAAYVASSAFLTPR